ncbi:MAG: sugar ABC transporter permease [Lachnospiraceae bacterium]|nr:sugar ABC transporter permease [Lachnospiraceae bacterium]MBD5499137.1 sugar ABC transporter permease [Lachnospiraceae bacterium]MBD5509925.1 sugar ABC transporter permease [Lachnospiraceae bacterium]MBD5538046.1 sugar ABC transporter permease [Lachnospiraceae bacterium]
MPNAIKPKKSVLFAYLIIPVVIFVFSVFVPLVTALVYSFFQWKGGPVKTFNGLTNYITLFKDSTFWLSFRHNIFLVLVCIVGQIGIAFIFVLMINSKLVKLKGIHRTFGFFPSTVAAVSIGFIWQMIYDYNRGLINWFLDKIGRADLRQVWLNNEGLVMLLVAIPLVWQWIGYYMVILLSAISSIDQEIFEVAELDGANAIQRAVYIVFPLVKNTILVCITLCIAGNMKAFDNIYVMTKGGPGTSSMVMAMYGYQVSFSQQNMGYGSAISVGIFVLSLLVIGGSQWLIGLMTKKSDV